MIENNVRGIMTIALMGSLIGCPAWGQEPRAGSRQESAKLYEGIRAAKVSLKDGLLASQSQGKPISAKFEMEDGKLQLSIYTMKEDKFSEVIVDHMTEKVAKMEPITGGDDLTAAKGQSQAMAHAKSSLDAAVGKALQANTGYRAVSVIPSLKDGHPAANVTLSNGLHQKVVSEKLD